MNCSGIWSGGSRVKLTERLKTDPQPAVGLGELGGELRRDA
jgi:hypothetical protein